MSPNRCTRRDFVSTLAAGLAVPAALLGAGRADIDFRIRTITAGVTLAAVDDFELITVAQCFLATARQAYIDQGYEVQTVRVASQALPDYLPDWHSAGALDRLRVLDAFAVEAGMPFSLGSVIGEDHHDENFADWVSAFIRATSNLNITARVASAEHGIHRGTCRAAAKAIAAIARTSDGGEGNFRFAATAFCPPGTPFFPAAWHLGERAFAIGLESPPLLTAAFAESTDVGEARRRLRERLNAQLGPVETLAREIERETGWRYLGIDTSPAPAIDASIGAAIETLTGAPFGDPSTLDACAVITETLQSLEVQRCGYSGLMLPVLEDPVLARRADEGRYGVSELLLYSSVCGTGLDVVPLPGDTDVAALEATIADVAALAARYRKPLSARLFPVPGKRAGDRVTFDNPHLTDANVMALG